MGSCGSAPRECDSACASAITSQVHYEQARTLDTDLGSATGLVTTLWCGAKVLPINRWESEVGEVVVSLRR